ncbi:P-loop containing nucleoside triphosphate hydrolase protein [Powellomyces hirtus]|nr:P-loop containing nucleoside triphosphate hydrolase protein [Powellomyces hirtus]
MALLRPPSRGDFGMVKGVVDPQDHPSAWLSPPTSATPGRQKTAPAAEPSNVAKGPAFLNPIPKAKLPPLSSQRIQVGVRVRPLPALKSRHPARNPIRGRSPLAPIPPSSRRTSYSESASRTPSIASFSLAGIGEPCLNITPAQPDVTQICDPSGRRPKREFAFDAVFAEEDGTECVYDRMVKALVEKCLEGYNGCVLAYGQTASGKTFTMEGCKASALHPPPSDPENRGLMLRVAADIVDYIEKTTEAERESHSDDVTSFCVKATYLEIYQESLTDLLCEKDQQADLRIRIDPDSLTGRELYVQGLTEREVVNLNDYVRVAQIGARRRTVGETNMNDVSSRSHAVLTLTIEQIQRRRGGSAPADIGSRKRSKIHLVDLAGSERAKDTGATGTRLKEGGSINQSLLSLGNVISALSSSTSRPSHVSYRDSKLTYLLSDSLGGNALTVMIACVSPAQSCYEETMSTLRFAERAKKVKLRATVNIDLQSLRISTLESEIAHLKSLLGDSMNGATKAKPQMRDAYTSTRLLPSAQDAETSPMECPKVKRSRWKKLTDTLNRTFRGNRGARYGKVDAV